MKTSSVRWIASLVGLCGAVAWTAHAKPHATPTPTPTENAKPSPGSLTPGPQAAVVSVTLARWLLEQDGGKDALLLPISEAIHSISGFFVRQIDPHDPGDARMIQLLGTSMDGVLPAMNKSDSTARAATFPDAVAATFEAALVAKLKENPEVTMIPTEPTVPVRHGESYPAFRVIQKANGKTFYLGVTLYETSARNGVAEAIRLQPVETAGMVTTDGSCLLVAVETNGKPGKEAAYLNWELLDLTHLFVRAAITFEASQNAVHAPDALLNDGRKGRD